MKIIKGMKLVMFAVVLFFGLPLTVSAQQTRKVLFLGNSYTYANNLPQMISQLAASTGDILIYDSNLIGGYTLEDHFASTVSRNKILSNDWDYVVLQEQSQRPAFIIPSAFMGGFSNLKTFIGQNKPCAQVTSFMTWGYLNGDSQNCASNPTACTYTGMQNLISDRYMQMSEIFDSEVTPAGAVWKFVKENYPEINLYVPDGSHPSLEGSYLAACCFYTSLFRKDPTLISNNYGLDSGTASIIKNATKSIVFDQMANWYIGKYVPNSNFNYKIGNGTNEVVISSLTPTYRNSLVWDFGDGSTSTALMPTHNYAADGSYTIRLTSNKCYLGQNIVSVFERVVNFCAHTNTILPNDLILCPDATATIYTQPAENYQWLDFFGNPIIGANSQSLVVYSGNYSVITTIDGCTETSPEILVDGWLGLPEECNLGVDDLEKSPIIIAPNPARNILNINTEETIKEVFAYNLLGERIAVSPISNSTFDISNLSEGIYIIKVLSEDERLFTARFVKE
ncbi:DUF4886 domain-containing protein [Flavobacterium sp.]